MKKITVCLLVLTLLVTGFIFSNSMKSGEESMEASNLVMEWLRPLLSALSRGDDAKLSFIVRKTAHVTEFCLLGICTFGFTRYRRTKTGRDFTGYAFFYVMLIAVLDEFLQHFTGRTSMVQDVLLDFSGALLGMGIVFLFEWAQRRAKNK